MALPFAWARTQMKISLSSVRSVKRIPTGGKKSVLYMFEVSRIYAWFGSRPRRCPQFNPED
jgi:hypothetical protein